MQLDSQQERVVHAPLMPTLVIAGAGTGKTHTLVHRVTHWTQSELDPQRTLLITFTQRAAREMGERMRALNPARTLPWIGTFHAIAARILRSHGAPLGIREDFRVITRYEAEHLMNEVLMHVGADLGSLDGRTLLRLNSLSVNADLRLYELIETRIRHGRLSPERLDEVMVQFLVSKLERNVMDYDDLLLYWSQLLGCLRRSDRACRDCLTPFSSMNIKM